MLAEVQPRPYTPEDDAEIIRMYQAGESYAAIDRALGRTSTREHIRLLARRGVVERRRPVALRCNPDPESFGGVLQEVRVRAGLSRNRLASRAGVDTSYLARLEFGEREPPRRYIIEAIADVLRLPHIDRSRLFLAAGYSPWRYEEVAPHVKVIDALIEALAR